MKLSHLSILFAAIMIIHVITADIRSDQLTAMADKKNDMDYNMDQAMESAVDLLLQDESHTIEKKDMEKAVDRFFTSMYASLGILSDPVAQERLCDYVPVIAATTEDGYYLMYQDEYPGKDGYIYLSRRWTEKKPYAFEDEDFIYRFTTGEELTLYDKNNVIHPTGSIKLYQTNLQAIRTASEFESLRNKVGSESFLLDTEEFITVRQQIIISLLEQELSWYISRYNEIASRYGITYRFTIPVTDASDWAKSIEGPGFLVIFQGMPLVENSTKVYNRTAFAGAGVRKELTYYVEQHSWYYLYHREGCPMLIGNPGVMKEQYASAEECSELGAYACEICDPQGVHPPDYQP